MGKKGPLRYLSKRSRPMDAALELIVKIVLAFVIIWFFSRITFVLTWFIQPFLAGFAAGVLVTILFVVRLKR